MIWKSICIGVAAVAFQTFAHAATFSSRCDADIEKAEGCTIIMSGEIVRGDNQRLIDILRSPKNSKAQFFRTILLRSLGGSIPEALLLAQTVTQSALNTTTAAFWQKDEFPISESHCVSACFLVWVAGAERTHVSSPATNGKNPIGIGLHRPYFASGDFAKLDPFVAAKIQQDLVVQVREYLKRHDVPDVLIDEMIKRSSKEVYWLDTFSGSDELSGTAPWFEELMISRCSFDPITEREGRIEFFKNAVALKETNTATHKKYVSWRQKYNACEIEFRKISQAKIIAGK